MGCGQSTGGKPALGTHGKPKKCKSLSSSKDYRSKNAEKVELTEGVVATYIQLEKDIHRLERANVVKKHEAKSLYADEIKKTVDQLEATHKELKKQTEKEKADVDNIEQPSVRAFLKQNGTWDSKFNKEQQEYLEALNKQEVADKELKGAKAQYERAAKIAELYKRRADKLNDLYEQQDRTLAGIFGGDYGSELENTLEGQLDHALEWQQRVSLAKFKWTNGRVLLVHACTQMAFGITRWKELKKVDLANTRMRYFAAAEARNNFIAAGQNVQSCRVYLGKVKFPYCTEDEMATMESTVNNAFTDIQTPEAYKKAHEIYRATHKKVAALIQWFDQVISETILKDLNKANLEVGKVQKELRTERLRLINDRVREKLGHDIAIDYTDIPDDDDDDELLALEADITEDASDLPGERLTKLLNMSKPDGRQPSPLSRSELAPLPSQEMLFGDVSKQLEEHGKQKEALQMRNDAQMEKLNMGLQDKIRQRQAAGGGGGPPASPKKKGSAGGKKKKSNVRRSRKERRMSVVPAGVSLSGG